MRSVSFALALSLAISAACFAQDATPAPVPAPAAEPAPAPQPDPLASGPGLYATFDTSLGQIVVRLLEDKTPKTVQNFVALVNGTKASADAEAKHMVKKRFYDNMIFHRVVKGFMIQTGDVKGTGSSNCGVDPIPDEFDPTLKFDVPGRLAMANLGRPTTAACQVFITVGAAPWLNGTFTIFGVVASGQDIADKIANVPAEGQRPVTPIALNKVTIERRDH